MAGGYGIRPYGDAVELSCIVGEYSICSRKGCS